MKVKFAQVEQTNDGPETLSTLTHTSTAKENLLWFNGQIDGHPAWILLDSGASQNFIDESFMKKHRILRQLATPFTVELANGHKTKITEEVQIKDL
jgi:hypothetical protein